MESPIFYNDNGVMKRHIWELMNMFTYCENDGLKNTIWFADGVVNIPSSVKVIKKDIAEDVLVSREVGQN